MMCKKLIIIALLFSVTCLQAQTLEKQLRQGNRQYHKGKFEQAKELYRKASEDHPTSAEAYFNLGDALYQQQNYDSATIAFQRVLETTPDIKLKSKAVFNMGNCLLDQGKYYDAFNVYKVALKYDSDNEDALYNLEYCRAHLIKSHVWIDQQIPHGMVEANEKEAFNGQMVTLTSKADDDYALSRYVVVKADDQQVTVDVSGSRFEMPKFDVIVTAEFKQLHQINIDKKTKNGTVAADRQKAIEGQQVTLHAQPEPRYMVDRYKVYKTGNPNDTVPVNDTVFQMPDFDVTVTATFRDALHVSVDSVANGQVGVTDSLALPGQTIGVIVRPNPGYQLDEIRVVCDKDPSMTAPVNDMNMFQMLDSDVTVTASFVESQEYYQVVADSTIEGGHVVLEVDTATRGETIMLRNVPEPGYQFKEYKICQLGDTSIHVQPLGNFFTMPGMDVMVSAVFEKQEGENQDQQQQDQQQEQQQEQDQEQQQNQQNQENQQDQQQQQKQNPQDISKEDAQRMLDALENQEKQTIEKVNEQKIRTQPKRKTDKDW